MKNIWTHLITRAETKPQLSYHMDCRHHKWQHSHAWKLSFGPQSEVSFWCPLTSRGRWIIYHFVLVSVPVIGYNQPGQTLTCWLSDFVHLSQLIKTGGRGGHTGQTYWHETSCEWLKSCSWHNYNMFPWQPWPSGPLCPHSVCTLFAAIFLKCLFLSSCSFSFRTLISNSNIPVN